MSQTPSYGQRDPNVVVRKKNLDFGEVTGADASYFQDEFFRNIYDNEAVFDRKVQSASSSVIQQRDNTNDDINRMKNIYNTDVAGARTAGQLTENGTNRVVAAVNPQTQLNSVQAATAPTVDETTRRAILGTDEQDFLGL